MASSSSAGNTRGLIEAPRAGRGGTSSRLSSAGNTRGLIEATSCSMPHWSADDTASSAGNTRGLIEACSASTWRATSEKSSAGNTRGLNEAHGISLRSTIGASLPRGIPAASLKRIRTEPRTGGGQTLDGLPRGIPAASLKQVVPRSRLLISLVPPVFRGEYPRPH